MLYASYADQYQFKTDSTEAGIGNLVPSAHHNDILMRASDQIIELVAAIGLSSGVYNTDIITSNDQIYILDFGARLGGNMLGEVHRLATGVDYTAAAIDLALGKTPEICANDKLTNAGHLVIHADKQGILKGFSLDPRLTEMTAIELYSGKVGKEIRPYMTTSDRIGILVIKSSNRADLLKIYNDPVSYFGLAID